jgi:hypothetical protein
LYWTVRTGSSKPHTAAHRFAAFFLSASMSFSTYLLNGDRLAVSLLVGYPVSLAILVVLRPGFP